VKQAAGMLRWFRMLSFPQICSTTIFTQAIAL
jgi:hypothetical protein